MIRITILSLALMALAVSGQTNFGEKSVDVDVGKKSVISTGTKAASDYQNCNCQCDSTMVLDQNGRRGGNCRT